MKIFVDAASNIIVPASVSLPVRSTNLSFNSVSPLALSSTCPNFSASNLATSFANASPTESLSKLPIFFNTLAISSVVRLLSVTQSAISILPKPLVVSFNLSFNSVSLLALSSSFPKSSELMLSLTAFANAAPTEPLSKLSIPFNTLAISSGLLLCSFTQSAISILPASVRLPVLSTNLSFKSVSLSSFPKLSELMLSLTRFANAAPAAPESKSFASLNASNTILSLSGFLLNSVMLTYFLSLAPVKSL